MPNPSLKPTIGTAASSTQRSWRARLSFICYAESIKKWEQRSGQQAAIGVDAIALMDALKLNRAILAGYDWGGRAACVVAALYPERCTGLVSVNSYLIQDIAKAGLPLSPAIKSGIWYQYYFQTERGRAGLAAIALRKHVRTALECRIYTIAKCIEFIPALLHPILEYAPPTRWSC